MSAAKYLNKALAEIKANHEREEIIAENKRNALYVEHPTLRTLDREIQSVFTDATRSMLNGNNVDFDEVSAQSLELQRKREKYLAEIGVDEDKLSAHFKCSLCNDTGYHNGKMCECVKRLASKMVYDELNADVPLDKCTFESFDTNKYPNVKNSSGINPCEIMTKIGGFCIKYADEFNMKSESLLFFGKTGLGKTHLSLAIANDVIKKGYNVIYGPISHIIKCIEDEHFSKTTENRYTLDSVIKADLLILDDLGTEFTTSFVTSTMYDIVNSRILSGKPTIINTNLDFSELEKKYTPRLVSRISGCYRLFQFFGDDIRTQL